MLYVCLLAQASARRIGQRIMHGLVIRMSKTIWTLHAGPDGNDFACEAAAEHTD